MKIRPIQYADLPALAELECAATLAALPQTYPSKDSYPTAPHLKDHQDDFRDPWVTFTLAEDEQGLCGWVKYTENQLRYLVVTERVRDSGLRDELYGEGLRHWKAGEVPRVWLWVLADDQHSRAFYESLGWKPTKRSRRSALAPHPVLVEYLLALGPF